MRAARELKVQWSESAPLIGHEALVDWARQRPVRRRGDDHGQGRRAARRGDWPARPTRSRATYCWPIQSHGSIGPSCAVADVRADGGTVWTASQASHRFLDTFAALVDLPRDKLRVIYLDGAGCYGMNGHDDAAAEAVLLSKAVGKPVRVQWSREDELGWDPKGPPQLLELKATLTPDGRIDAWQTDMWVPRATANLEWMPLLSPLAAGMRQPVGPVDRAGVAERRSAVRRQRGEGVGALARPGAAAAIEHPRARQGGELLRGRELRRRAGGQGEDRSARVPAARPGRSARRRGDAARWRS